MLSQDLVLLLRRDLEMLRSGKLACEKANEKYAEELRLIRKQLIDIECEHNTMMADLQQCRHDLDLAVSNDPHLG